MRVVVSFEALTKRRPMRSSEPLAKRLLPGSSAREYDAPCDV